MAYMPTSGYSTYFWPVFRPTQQHTIHLRLPKVSLEEIETLQDAKQGLFCYAMVSHTNKKGDMSFAEFKLMNDGSYITAEPFKTQYMRDKKVKAIPGLLEHETDDAEYNKEHFKPVLVTHPSPSDLLREDNVTIRPSRMNETDAAMAETMLNQQMDEVLEGYAKLLDAEIKHQQNEKARQDAHTAGKKMPERLKFPKSELLNGEGAPIVKMNRSNRFLNSNGFMVRQFKSSKPIGPESPSDEEALAVDPRDIIKGYYADRPRRLLPDEPTTDVWAQSADPTRKRPKPKARNNVNASGAFYYAPDPMRPKFKRERPHCKLVPKENNAGQKERVKELKSLLNGNFEVWLPLDKSHNDEPHFYVLKRNRSTSDRTIEQAARYRLIETNGGVKADLCLYENGKKTPLTHPVHNMSTANLQLSEKIASIVADDADKCWRNEYPKPAERRPHFKFTADATLPPVREELTITNAQRFPITNRSKQGSSQAASR